MLKKTAKSTRPLHKDAYCRIYEDVNGVIHVGLNGGEVITPSPAQYEGFTAADFAGLYEELVDGGIPAKVAGRWVNQGMGFDGI